MRSLEFSAEEYAALQRLPWEEWILDPTLLEQAIGELQAGGEEHQARVGTEWSGTLSDAVAQALCEMLRRAGSLSEGSDARRLADELGD
jgi:hypothetical protein